LKNQNFRKKYNPGINRWMAQVHSPFTTCLPARRPWFGRQADHSPGRGNLQGGKKETHLSIPIEKVGLALNNSLT
jgi:hypothetical protein